VKVQVIKLLYYSVSAEVMLLIIRELKDFSNNIVWNTEPACVVLGYIIKQLVNKAERMAHFRSICDVLVADQVCDNLLI
jgi:hypothetical protein